MAYYKLDADKAFLISQKALLLEDSKLLVLENSEAERGGVSEWELPGGLLELDEPLEDGLLREIREETGLEASVGEVFTVWEHREPRFVVQDGRSLEVRVIELAYWCTRRAGEIRLSHEHRQYRWASRDTLQTLVFCRNSQQAVAKYLSVPRQTHD